MTSSSPTAAIQKFWKGIRMGRHVKSGPKIPKDKDIQACREARKRFTKKHLAVLDECKAEFEHQLAMDAARRKGGRPRKFA